MEQAAAWAWVPHAEALAHLVYGINEAGFVIHSAIHKARHDVDCIIHTHTLAGTGGRADDASGGVGAADGGAAAGGASTGGARADDCCPRRALRSCGPAQRTDDGKGRDVPPPPQAGIHDMREVHRAIVDIDGGLHRVSLVILQTESVPVRRGDWLAVHTGLATELLSPEAAAHRNHRAQGGTP